MVLEKYRDFFVNPETVRRRPLRKTGKEDDDGMRVY